MESPNSSKFTSALLTESEAASYLGRSLAFMRRDRYAGTGPAYVRIGKSIRYRQSDLDQFLKKKTVLSVQECDVEVPRV